MGDSQMSQTLPPHDGQPHAELYGTHQQQLIFLNMHWGAGYSFECPQAPGGQWTATAKFGQHDEVQAFSAAELLEEVRAHYYANRSEGSQGDGPLSGQTGAQS
jgi:hypothetical protein